MSLAEKFQKLTGPNGSLRQRSIGATFWSVGGVGLSRSLSLVSNLIMTRLLMPEAFGLMAMVITVMMMVNMISDIGIRQSITRDARGEDLSFLRVAWTVQILRSLIVALGVAATGIAIGIFGPSLASPDSVYADPRLPWLICASTLAIVLRGLESPSMHVAARRLDLRKVTMIEIINQAITIVIMVALAQVAATVWVLLGGLLIGAGQRTIWTHTAFRNLPMRLSWDREISAGLWTFGRWLIVSSIAGFVVNQGDRFLLGALLDAQTFGLYVIATLWLQPPQLILNQLTSRVFYSGVSEKLRADPERVHVFLAQVRKLIDVMILAAFAGAFLIGPVLIEMLYTDEYAHAAAFLTILSFRYLARRQTPLGSFLLAEGKSRLMAGSILVSAAAMLVGVPIVYHLFGLNAAVMMVALAPLGGTGLLIRNAKGRMAELDIRGDILWNTIVIFSAILFVAAGTPVPW